jgi:hypothetical protein
MLTRNTCLAAIALLSLTSLVGCGNSTQEALAFNQKIVSANQKLSAAGQEFGQSVGRAVAGGPAEAAQSRQLYNKARQAVKDVKAEMQSVQVPSSNAARALYEAHQKFLDSQEHMIDKDFGELVKVLEDSKMDKSEKAQKIEAVITRAGKVEQSDLETLKAAQRTFAQEYNLKVQ